jgi:hypothetical protein
LPWIEVESELPIEFGEFEVDHQWKELTLNRSFKKSGGDRQCDKLHRS